MRANLPERIERRLLGGIDDDVRAEAIAGQFAAVGLVIGHDDRFDAAAGQGGDRRETDRSRADDDGDLARLDLRRPNVELTDGERVGQRDCVAGDVTRNRFGRRLRNHQQLTETPLGRRVLTDDAHAAGAAVDQAHRHRRHPQTDRKLVGAAGSMPDDLADELVPEHDVAVRVVQRTTGRVVDGQLRVVHEVHIGCADRGAQCPEQQFARPRCGVRCLADL